MTLTGNKKGFSLKRLSHLDGENPADVLTVTDFEIEESASGEILRIRQKGHLYARHIWGTGERYHTVDLRGSFTDGCVTEKFTQQGDQTYMPIPFFMTDRHLGCFVNASIPVRMDFRGGLTIEQRTQGNELLRETWFFSSPASILRQFIASTGSPLLPPDWTFGVWISANGWNCDAEVETQLQALRQYDYPADVIVLEAWSDERTFYQWNDESHWRSPSDIVRRIREAGLHLILWQIPVIKQERNGEPGVQLLADEQEAIERKLCVFRKDGQPYRIPEGVWFSGSLLPDFTNPETCRWWFEKRKHLLDMGVEGFKTDGGEFLLDDTVLLHDGSSGLEAHNRYPGQYIAAYHRFMAENGIQGVTFSRADSTGAQMRPLHWAGDQLSVWSELRAQLRAGISAGLSGVLFWGFDIGGFAGELPSGELYLRATAFACFCPIMQWHAEPRSGQFYATHPDGFVNDRSPWNLAEKLNDPSILEISAEFARLRKALQPYLVREAAYCTEHGRPMMAHLCLDYPEDENACACEDQYMLGRMLLVCPIVEKGVTSRQVWLPMGTWKHYFTGETLKGGQSLTLPCPLRKIIVFERVMTDEA
ncbi:MAG: glycoside hydrolase family 31 protein [Clostridia bacterium]|nr:glycoside hydrolase family 31 protein [Clostridia bacterium]